jgi:hypothetical protein
VACDSKKKKMKEKEKKKKKKKKEGNWGWRSRVEGIFWKRNSANWRKIGKRIWLICQKMMKFQLFLKTFLTFTITFLLVIFLLLTLHYVPIKVLIWSQGMYGLEIFMTNQWVWCKLFFSILSWDYLFFFDLTVFIWSICEMFDFWLHYSAHIYLRVLHVFQSDFNCWVLTLIRLESKHNYFDRISRSCKSEIESAFMLAENSTHIDLHCDEMLSLELIGIKANVLRSWVTAV